MGLSPRRGLIAAVAAYVIWGLFPLFWRLLGDLDPLEVVCHRIVWSAVMLTLIVGGPRWLRRGTVSRQKLATTAEIGLAPTTNDQGPLVAAAPRPSGLSRHQWSNAAAAAAVIVINWLAFIWAVNNDRVLESALGYYIAPLVSVALGVVVLSERLSRWQWIATALAMIGVALIGSASRSIPWAALAMAFSFATYGLVKKHSTVPPLFGLWMENAVLFLPAMIYLVIGAEGSGVMGRVDRTTDSLLVLGGIVTVPPLMLFAMAARVVPLATIGMLQYIAPTLQFLLGVGIAGERLNVTGLIGFGFVWAGSLLYLTASHRRYRRRAADIARGAGSKIEPLG